MKTTTKLNNIQALRAFAAFAVVLYHSGFTFPHMLPFGTFGVEVFFVISGFIMARILDPHSDSSSDFFFRRRVLRIVPPYWFFTLLLFFAAMRIPQLLGSTRADFVDLLKSLFFIPFDKGNGLIRPLLFIGWSLNYEMFFYLALTIGLFIHKRRAAWIGAALVIVSMVACTPFAGQNVFARFYSQDYVLEFVFGILSYYLCRAVSDGSARKLRLLTLVLCFGSALLLIAIQAFYPPSSLPHFYLSHALVMGAPAFVLVTSASLLSQARWDTRLGWLVLLGDASYILYLIHPYCEYSLDRLLGTRHHWLASRTVTGAVAGVSLSVVLAVVLHLYAERPTVRFLNRRFGGKRKSVEFGTSTVR